MSRVTERDWFELWYADKESIINCMISNMQADLNVGYDPQSTCIRKQRETINEYQKAFTEQIEAFKNMEEKAVNRWCYYDLKHRGAIS